jgi:tRNA-specific 2-thiouridylase
MTNSLGFDKAEKDTRVVVAMSGGVDSSAVAALLHGQGYEVIGITLQLYDHGAMVQKKGACCAGQDIHDARRVAERLGIPHYVLNYESKFKESVMDDFVETYLAGETPIPCVKCNQSVKFKDLLKTARELGADCMATGHYVQRDEVDGRGQMLRAADLARDQSYFLFATTQEQLDFLRFPLGHLKSKDETRALAAQFGLQVADKPDSQDICFVPNGNYVSVIEKLRPGALEGGDIIHIDGTVLGLHEGIINYTVGQRKGLGIAHPELLFVIKLDAEKKRVIVGPKEALAVKEFVIRECNWLGQVGPLPNPPPYAGEGIIVKLRSAHAGAQATIVPLDNNRARVTLFDAQMAVSPGQACVAYDGDRMLGGGWICNG